MTKANVTVVREALNCGWIKLRFMSDYEVLIYKEIPNNERALGYMRSYQTSRLSQCMFLFLVSSCFSIFQFS